MSKTLSEIKSTLTKIKPYIKDKYHISELGIFGSYVRGEETSESDIDILVSFDSDFHFGLVTYCELENYLSSALDIPVDLVMKDSLKKEVGNHILKEVLYL